MTRRAKADGEEVHIYAMALQPFRLVARAIVSCFAPAATCAGALCEPAALRRVSARLEVRLRDRAAGQVVAMIQAAHNSRFDRLERPVAGSQPESAYSLNERNPAVQTYTLSPADGRCRLRIGRRLCMRCQPG